MDQPTLTPTDQELVDKAKRDPETFAAIVERYQQPLLRYIQRLGCRQPDDAQDVLQETFIKVYLNFNDYDPSLKFSSWLYRITHNETISYFRKIKTKPQPAATEDQLLLMENIKSEINLTAETDKKLLAEKINQGLKSLDIKYSEPLTLRYLEEKSYEEISDILQIPIGTVGTLINRGKQKLRDYFGANKLV